jgi:hypothetical protein
MRPSYTPEFGRINATSRSNPLSPSTGTPTVSMEACAEHAQYQFPNQHSIVGFLLDAIQNNVAGLQAAIASVRTYDGPTGNWNDFEAANTHLLPNDPVAMKMAKNPKTCISPARRLLTLLRGEAP